MATVVLLTCIGIVYISLVQCCFISDRLMMLVKKIIDRARQIT